jgi:hypothetical protein
MAGGHLTGTLKLLKVVSDRRRPAADWSRVRSCPAGTDSRRGMTSSSIQAMGVGAYPHEEGGAMPWSPMRRTHGWRRR